MTNPGFYIYAPTRSGSHYLKELLRTRFDADTKLFHQLDNYTSEIVISVIRDPFDSIVSTAAQLLEDRLHELDKMFPLIVEKIAKIYVDTLNTIYLKSDIIIDFRDLVNSPNIVAVKISSLTGKEIVNSHDEIKIREEPKESAFLPSSKNLVSYDLAKQKLLNSDILSEANDAYNMLLTRVI